jgi:putative ABC transport system permease protein
MLAPMIARPVSRIVGAPAARLRGAAGTIARQNAMRSARRTAATASALMIGTALMAGSLILSGSFTESVDRAVTRGAVSDLVITAPGELGFSPALADDVREVPGVAASHPYRTGAFKIDDSTKEIVGLPPDAIDLSTAYPSLDIAVTSGDVQELRGDGLAVSEDVANDRGWSLGDAVDATFPTGDSALRIVALFDETALIGDYVIGLDTFAERFAETNDFLVLVSIDPSADLRSVQSSLQALVDEGYPGLDVMDRDQYIGDVRDQVNQLLSLITALLSLAVLIALLGVLITMLLAVFERTRELGMLRAVGMARSQTRAMVRWEAAIVSIYGAFLGLLLGAFFGLALTSALEEEGVTEQVVPIPSLIFLAIVIVLLGIGAAVYPARRAARLDILRAISHQ